MKLAEASTGLTISGPKSINFKLPALRQGLGWGPRMVRFLMGPARACIQLRRIVTAANCAPGEEISRKLVVTCGDGAEVLEPIEEALDQISFTIECEVALPLDVSVGLGRMTGLNSTLGESFDERIGVISFVANQGLWVGVLD